MLGDVLFRNVSRPLWDVPARVAQLDAHEVAVQVVSPVPIMLAYWAVGELADEYARVTNDSVAAMVGASQGRFRGLGTVALQDPTLAVRELRRVVGELGLDGVEVGAHIAGRELDDEALRPFWACAEELGASVFIHPLDGGGDAIRRRGQPYDWGLAMLTDTAMATVALLNGGILEAHPTLRIALSHGCGTFPWAFPRLKLGSRLFNAAVADRYDELVRRLWVDSLVFDPEHLRLLAHRFGADRVVVGTDFPFVPGQLEGVRTLVDEATRIGALAQSEVAGVLAGNAAEFLGRSLDSICP